jgi:stage II sporulation protein M
MYRIRFLRAALIILVIFGITSGMGALAVSADPELGRQLLEFVREQIVGQVLDADPITLAMKIFLNNLQACLLLFLGGASLALFTFFIIGMNGLVIGGIMELIRQQQGFFYVIAGIVPHGIFEIPSFIISGALGLMLAEALWAEWYGQASAADTASYLGKIFVAVVVPLVALAAIVEAFITPAVINLVI